MFDLLKIKLLDFSGKLKIWSIDFFGDRTLNQHRWICRVYKGDWGNHVEGIRQNDSVTSGERVFFFCQTKKKRKITGEDDCLTKTQDFANLKKSSMKSDACPVLVLKIEK